MDNAPSDKRKIQIAAFLAAPGVHASLKSLYFEA